MRSGLSTRLSRHSAGEVDRDPTLMETLCGTLQWLETIEDLDQENRALTDLNRAIRLQIAELEIQEEDEPSAA
jgi:hypothetical protein